MLTFVEDALRFYMEFHSRYDGFYGAFIHDALAVASALDPGLIKTKSLAVEVELGGKWTTGETVTDWRRSWGRPRQPGRGRQRQRRRRSSSASSTASETSPSALRTWQSERRGERRQAGRAEMGWISGQFTTRVIVLMPVAIAINIVLGYTIQTVLKLPIYMDSIGTILVGVLAGPLAGALTGV